MGVSDAPLRAAIAELGRQHCSGCAIDGWEIARELIACAPKRS